MLVKRAVIVPLVVMVRLGVLVIGVVVAILVVSEKKKKE